MKRTLALVAALVLCTLPILLISLVLGIKSLFGGFLFERSAHHPAVMFGQQLVVMADRVIHDG